MQNLNEFIQDNPKMKLAEISKLYGVSVSAISKRRAILGIKHETSEICKMISTMLHMRNIDIANKLGCTQSLVAVVRHKEGIRKSTQRVDLTEAQKQIVIHNFNRLTLTKLAELVGVSIHVLRSRIAEMKLYNQITNDIVKSYNYDLDNGKGFFDLEKYKLVML